MLGALCNGDPVDEAKNVFHDMLSKRPHAFTYSIFIHSYCDSNDLQSAFRVLDRMRRYNLLPNVFTYSCIIKHKWTCGRGLSIVGWNYFKRS